MRPLPPLSPSPPTHCCRHCSGLDRSSQTHLGHIRTGCRRCRTKGSCCRLGIGSRNSRTCSPTDMHPLPPPSPSPPPHCCRHCIGLDRSSQMHLGHIRTGCRRCRTKGSCCRVGTHLGNSRTCSPTDMRPLPPLSPS